MTVFVVEYYLADVVGFVVKILDSQTNPIGKFLRDLGVSAADVIQLNIMPHLDEVMLHHTIAYEVSQLFTPPIKYLHIIQAPRKPRTVYGKRKDLPPMDRKALNRERNREHAKSTRKRRKIFETVLDQQLRKLGQVICSSFTEEQTNRYLIRRNRRVENLVGFFLLMNSDISSDIPVNWQCCLSRHVNVFVQTQGVLEVEHQGQACYAASNGVLHLNPFSDIAQQQHRGSQSSPVCINGPSYSQVQDSVLSHGIVGHHLSRVSLVSNLTPQHTAATSSTLSCEQSDAFLGLPLCLLKFPVSPDAGHMKLQQTPVRNIYKGFEALGQATKMILRALQEAVYHVLLTHSFYRKIFDLLVPGTTSCDVSSIDLVNAWTKGSTTPLNEKHQQRLHDGTPLVHESGHSSSVDCNIDHSCQTPAPAARNLLFTKFTEEKEKTEQRLKIQEGHSTYNLEMSGGFNCDSVMSRGGMLCYPSSLTSPCGIHESLGRDVVGGIDNCSGSGESDSMRTCNKGNFDCDGGTGHRTPLISKSHDSPASSNKEFEFTMASSLASESPNQKSYMLHHPPTFSLEHLIPVNVKFLISNSKNDLLVQGTEAMCSFDVEVETKLHTEKQEGKGNSVSLNHESPTKVSNEGNMDDKGNDSTKHAINDKLHGARTDKTLVNVPGALASFVFDSDVGGGSKIVECNFDLDINAVALRYLDSSTLLRNYFGRISKDSERSDFVAATTV